jgi:flagellar hook-associated protein 1 FlgK
MGTLFTTLLNSAGTLRAYARTFNVIQNNITNVHTPGYARQDQVLLALPFDPATGLPGGVLPGPMVSARSEFLEQAVRQQQENFGRSRQRSADLAQVEPLFTVAATAGLPNAWNEFFGSFSRLAVNPNDLAARQVVIDRAGQVAESFRQTASGIGRASANVDRQTVDAVDGINRLAGEIARINTQYRANAEARNDAGLGAQLHTALEELAGFANFTVIKTPDGAANVYLGGQTPLVIGDRTYRVDADLSAPQAVIRDWEGKDITAQLSRGRLGALLEAKNATLAGYLADLHQLAAGFADAVNTQLALGLDINGVTPATNLFTYNVAGDAASSIAVTAITPQEIAAAAAGGPGGNGNAIAVAQLAGTPSVGGLTFTEFFGNLGARVGRDLAGALQDRALSEDRLLQARNQRSEQTGVSLDEEAAKLLQFQQAYQAAAKLVTVIDELTDSLFQMIR